MGSGNQRTRRARRAHHGHATQSNFEDPSAMNFDDLDHTDDKKDDDRRRNTSSEDEGDDNQGQPITAGLPMDPNVASLVSQATQMIGLSEQDGTAMALAATSADNPTDALNLLAASSAMANVRAQRANKHAAQAVVESDLAITGLGDADSMYEKRFKHYNEELQRMMDHRANDRVELLRLTDRVTQLELQRLTDRVALLERLLSRLISMFQNGNVDATEIEQMIRNLGI